MTRALVYLARMAASALGALVQASQQARPPTGRGACLAVTAVAAASMWPAGLAAAAEAADAGPALLCRTAIAVAEAEYRIPDLFLSAIGRVESGRTLAASGQVVPWPWTVDAEGQGSTYPTKAAALAAVRAMQARGIRSIDVGCLQVNLQQHPDAFGSLEEAFDPAANAAFAARFLGSLFKQMGSWPLAAAAYHSQTPALGAPYQQRVLAAWATPDRLAATLPAGAQGERPATGSAAAGSAKAPVSGALQPPVTGMAIGGRAVTSFNRDVQSPAGQASAQSGPIRGRDLSAYRRYPVMMVLHQGGRPG